MKFFTAQCVDVANRLLASLSVVAYQLHQRIGWFGLFLILWGCADAPSEPPPLKTHYQRAIERLTQNQFREAFTAAQLAALEEPNSPGAQRILGFLMVRAGHSARALKFFHRALEIDHVNIAVHNDLACVYAAQKKYIQAMFHLERALDLSPGLVLLHYNIGSLKQYIGEYRLSEVAYKRALALAPEDGKTHRGLGDLYLREGRYAKAKQHFDSAITANRRFKQAHLGLAQISSEKKDFVGAVGHYLDALGEDPNYIEAHYGLAQAYRSMGELEKSLKAQRTFETLGPLSHPKVLLVLSDPKQHYATSGSELSKKRKNWTETGTRVESADVRFVDVSRAAGIEFRHTSGATGEYYMIETMGAGTCFFDIDGDGHLDLYFVDGHALPSPDEKQPRNRLYINRRNGTFEDAASINGSGYGMGCAIADCNNDGLTDLYVTNFGPNALYTNRGHGNLTHFDAGVDNALWSTSAAFFDYDNDGDVDLYVANYLDFSLEHNEICRNGKTRDYCDPKEYGGSPDALYKNNGETWVEITSTAGMYNATGKGLGVALSDYDDDGDVDLYVANDGTPNFLYRNRGDGTFSEEGLVSGTAYNREGLAEAGMGASFGDYNNDGRSDIFVTNYSHESNTLYRNDSGGRFTDQTALSGMGTTSLPYVGFGTHFFDYDNDGDDDLFVANGHILANIEQLDDLLTYAQPAQLYLNEGGLFRDVSNASGLVDLPRRVGRGSAYGDYDDDGDLDIVVTSNNGPATLLRNEGGNRNNWLHILIAGNSDQFQGAGTRVVVSSAEGKQFKDVNAGGSYLSGSAVGAFFGLGHANHVLVSVRWPDGTERDLGEVAVNQKLFILTDGEH